MEAKELAVRQKSIAEYLEEHRDVMARALPEHLKADRMIRVSLACIASNPRLLECTRHSLYRAVMQSAHLGLELGSVLGQAYLIPYKIGGVMTAAFQIGYRGLVDLAGRTGRISKIWSHVVFARDHFEFQLGTDERIIHRPFEGDDPGAARCVYACAKHLHDESPAMVILWPRDVAARKAASHASAKQDSPWNHKDWVWEMWRKTATIALCKMLPMSPERLQEAAMIGEHEGMGPMAPHVIDVDPVEAAREAIEAPAQKRATANKKSPAPEEKAKAAPPEPDTEDEFMKF
jgi:recombination protein RecT